MCEYESEDFITVCLLALTTVKHVIFAAS